MGGDVDWSARESDEDEYREQAFGSSVNSLCAYLNGLGFEIRYFLLLSV